MIGGVSLAFLTYNAGYYLPFGGGSLGPRFLIPLLPFLAVPLSIAYRRFPAMTIALAIPSAIMMLAGTITQPLLGNDDTGYWAHLIQLSAFEHTIATVFGAGNGWLALLPLLVPLALAIGLTAFATRGTASAHGRDVRGNGRAGMGLSRGGGPEACPRTRLGHRRERRHVGAHRCLRRRLLATLLGRAALERAPRMSRAPELAPGRRGA